jgi:hypothetical protein
MFASFQILYNSSFNSNPTIDVMVVSRFPFGGLEAEVSIAEKTMVTMEQ